MSYCDPLEVRFHRFVPRDRDMNECWPWRGFKNADGYGKLNGKGNSALYAHRVAYELHVGPIPAGLIVRHKCDNPSCVNPLHLETGTHADNGADKARRGRSTTTIPDEVIIAVFSASGTCQSVADRYGVSPAYVSLIKNHKARTQTMETLK